MSTALRFTVDEYQRMFEQGILAERGDVRTELINGEIRELTPANAPHSYIVDLVTSWTFETTSRDQVHVRVQNPLGIPELDSMPEPDVAWLEVRNYGVQHPRPEDVLLLIEVSDSTLAFDRREKLELYASAKIKDYWIVNLVDSCVEVHRDPFDSSYKTVTSYQVGQSVSHLLFPDVSLEVGSLFSA